MRTRLTVGAVALMLLVAICGCDPHHRRYLGPELPVAFGVRVTDGKLRIWTGSPCIGTTSINLMFKTSPDAAETLRLQTPGKSLQVNPPPGASRDDIAPDPGVQVEYLTLSEPYLGFDVVHALPPGFDWQTARNLLISLDGPPNSWPGQTDLAEAIDGSAQNPGRYWFDGFGWLDPAEVAAKNGKTLLTLCEPDPDVDPGPPRIFGARVTDGALRIWPGPYCGPVRNVILTFQPGQADLVLTADPSNSIPFENLTATGPYPGFHIAQPLPNGFDWRTAQSALLRVIKPGATFWTTQMDLTTVVAESARHSKSTYWFPGFGWLDSAQVAEQDGKTLLTTCAQKN